MPFLQDGVLILFIYFTFFSFWEMIGRLCSIYDLKFKNIAFSSEEFNSTSTDYNMQCHERN